MHEIFLINLDHHAGRLRFMEAQLAALGLRCTRFRAVNGYDPSEIANADVASFANLSAGEIGVWESHRGIWREILRRDLPGAIVLEDDMALASDFADLHFSPELMEEVDVIKLDYFRQPSTYGARGVEVAPGRHVHRLVGSERSAGGYFVTQAGARRLLAGSESYFEPVDQLIFIDSTKLFSELRIWKVMPAVAAQMRFVTAPDELPAEIEDGIQYKVNKTGRDRRPRMSLRAHAMLRLRRLLDRDTTTIRQRRQRARLDEIRAAEGIVEAHPLFESATEAHFRDTAAFAE